MANGHRPKSTKPLGGRLWLVLLAVPLVVLLVGGGIAIGRGSARHGSEQQAASPSASAATTTRTTLAPTTTTHGAAPATTTTVPLTTTTRTVPTTTRGTGSVLGSALARPDRVAALMDVDTGGAGGADCGDTYDQLHQPTVVLELSPPFSAVTFERVGSLKICAVRFDAGAPIDITIAKPGGATERHTATAPCSQEYCYSSIDWSVMPGDPLGDYGITAVQGDLRATGVVHVRPASRHRVRSLQVVARGGTFDPNRRVTVRAGTTIVIAITGFEPRQLVDLLFYYTREGPEKRLL